MSRPMIVNSSPGFNLISLPCANRHLFPRASTIRTVLQSELWFQHTVSNTVTNAYILPAKNELSIHHSVHSIRTMKMTRAYSKICIELHHIAHRFHSDIHLYTLKHLTVHSLVLDKLQSYHTFFIVQIHVDHLAIISIRPTL